MHIKNSLVSLSLSLNNCNKLLISCLTSIFYYYFLILVLLLLFPFRYYYYSNSYMWAYVNSYKNYFFYVKRRHAPVLVCLLGWKSFIIIFNDIYTMTLLVWHHHRHHHHFQTHHQTLLLVIFTLFLFSLFFFLIFCKQNMCYCLL